MIDLETDPFEHGRIPKAFAAGFYDGTRFVHFWGPECLSHLVQFLTDLRPAHVVYAHNGGRFDFFFLLNHLENPLKIIGGRITSARIASHELRDSFSILPVPLASYEKTSVDYRLFSSSERENHRPMIVDYLRDDCVNLFELVSAFEARFGRNLTLAGTAIKELRKIHEVQKCGSFHDAKFRPFYFGGRVECFEAGDLRDDWLIADVNSMYPHAMANFDHPDGREFEARPGIDLDDPQLMFATVECTSRGALPIRTDEGLRFPHTRATFTASAHELRAGVDLGLIDLHKCLAAFYWPRIQRFDGFVQSFMTEKIDAEQRGDKAGRLLAKLALNSAYGKFAQDPEKFGEFMLRRQSDPLPPAPWELYADHGAIEVWKKPAPIYEGAFYDVAIAASITGAARAELLRAIATADRPIYCDTDSLIARQVSAPIHATQLGAWKIEETADRVGIAGKKLYVCLRGGEVVKYACKGVKINPLDILDIARGDVREYTCEAPSFTLKQTRFITRQIRSTANV